MRVAVLVFVGALYGPLATGAVAANLTTEVAGVRVEVVSAPETPLTDRKTVYTVRLADAAGKPVTDARITLTASMADGMTAAAPLRAAGAPGTYRGEVLFTMEGRWDLLVRVARQAGRLEIPIRETVAK